MNHQWIDTDGELDTATKEAFDAFLDGSPDHDRLRDRMLSIFAKADAAIESTPVGERISFESVIVANQIADNEDAFYE